MVVTLSKSVIAVIIDCVALVMLLFCSFAEWMLPYRGDPRVPDLVWAVLIGVVVGAFTAAALL